MTTRRGFFAALCALIVAPVAVLWPRIRAPRSISVSRVRLEDGSTVFAAPPGFRFKVTRRNLTPTKRYIFDEVTGKTWEIT